MKVYVVMCNDFPECVFEDEAAADRYVVTQKEAAEKLKGFGVRRIYWRVYEFEVKRDG